MPQSVTSQSSYYSTVSQYREPVGKKELLNWCSEIASVSCNRLEDLRSGVVLLRIMSKIWPSTVNLKHLKWKVHPRNENDISINWDTIRTCMVDLKLPMEVYDRKAIMTGRFKKCYTFLVMLFFLQNLSQNHDFSVDFAHPIDGKLASFLQSTDSVECLARGGGLRLEDIPRDDQSDVFSESSSIASYQTSKYSQPSQFSRPSSSASTFDIDMLTSSSAAGAPGFRSYYGTSQPGNYAAPDGGRGGSYVTAGGVDQIVSESISEGNFAPQNQRPQQQHPIHAQRSPAHSSTTASSSYSFLSNTDKNFDVYGRGVSLSSMDSSLNSGSHWEGDVQNIPFDANRTSSASQTMVTNRKMEKMLIRSLKAKREIEELKRMLEESYEKMRLLEGDCDGDTKETQVVYGKDPEERSNASDGILSWKSGRNKRRGELLLTKMRYEIESLNRQISYLKQEKEFVIKKAENRTRELQSTHENELAYQRDLHHNQTTTQQLVLLNEKLKDQRDYSLELGKIHDEISFEADRIRQSGLHTEDDEAIEDELLRLRQLRVAQSHQVRALEEGNRSLQELCDKLQSNLRTEQDKNRKLHEHYKLEEIEIFGEEYIKSAAPTTEQIGHETSDDTAATPQAAQPEQQTVPLQQQRNVESAALSKRERSLLIQLNNMEDELKTLQAKYNADVEHLKFGLFKHQQKPTSKLLTITKDPMEIEFDQEQKIERIESELARLKRANEYLRERSVLFDELNTEKGHDGYSLDNDNEEEAAFGSAPNREDEANSQERTVLVPSPYIGNPENMDAQYGQLVYEAKELSVDATLSNLHKEKIGNMVKLFWKVASDVAILQQRIRRSSTTLISLDNQCHDLSQERAVQYPQFQQTIDRIRSEYKLELEQLRQEHGKERASLQINLQLLEDNLREIRDEMLEGPSHTSKLFELAMLDDARRFWGLRQKVKYSQEEITAYRLREKLWTQLIECQRKNIEYTEQFAAAESYEEAMEINLKREELDMEATNLMQQLQTLTQQQQQQQQKQRQRRPEENTDEDEIDMAVKEATALAQNQINQVNKKLEDVVKQRERDIDRIREFDHKVKDLQLELEKERLSQETIHNEYRDVLRQKNDEANTLNEQQLQDRERIDALQAQITGLRQQIEEMTEHPESWGMGNISLDESVVITMNENDTFQMDNVSTASEDLAKKISDERLASSMMKELETEATKEPGEIETDVDLVEAEAEEEKEEEKGEEEVEMAPKTPEMHPDENDFDAHPAMLAPSPVVVTNNVED